MRIGIYGGSFNPIHRGHVNIIKYVMKEKKLDKIIVVPVGNPSHREGLISGKIRMEMAVAACSEIDNIEVTGEETSYTYDTFLNLKKIYKGSEFYEIIGEDSADYLHEWKDYEKMVEEVKFIVLKRKGFDYTSVHPNIEMLESPMFPFSSTEVREAISEGKDISNMICEKVAEIIKKYKLYGIRET